MKKQCHSLMMLDKEDDSAIIEKFEPVNVRDDFEYAFKCFQKHWM